MVKRGSRVAGKTMEGWLLGTVQALWVEYGQPMAQVSWDNGARGMWPAKDLVDLLKVTEPWAEEAQGEEEGSPHAHPLHCGCSTCDPTWEAR